MEKQVCEKLLNIALQNQKKSYSPYSKYKVGVALLCEDGKIYNGANIENSAFGPSCCAERIAVYNAVMDGNKKFKAIAIVGGDLTSYGYPCGVCRQVLNEFVSDLIIIVGKMDNGKLIYETKKLSEIFKCTFNFKNEE